MDVEAISTQTTQDEGAVTTTETIEHVDAAEDMAHDGHKEGATTEDMGPQQDVEAVELETDDDGHFRARDLHDSSDGVSAPSAEKVSSLEADEQEVVDTIATLAIEKPASDESGFAKRMAVELLSSAHDNPFTILVGCGVLHKMSGESVHCLRIEDDKFSVQVTTSLKDDHDL
ncbi:hypothetical protein KC19_VG324600 [Ceratodon purpureus]|uniref:Uncharacterized protein n=1 Tax=Ceratodon purpureus TaxID=3225 RepID=A0A8T0HVP8_CERPU|nr:hypothetical protein KC19_VG324600 [Ceratodon purpureus]